ncbi:YqgE/AlgH family protein [Riemerella columbipharyngis]|uniref:Putative transcriptional regulator n=1 Tax=Riemerella columbipharyngis TaxID=1071918 RepID=A0A1G6YS29_9FLAO|nr:YqgE/AlgH family protein [Riemerella columbipharyngis]SDD92833.1 putative transcriptional regulator [Riemerella columbipharyngis]
MNISYKGKILISTPNISGDIFSRSVVLIIEHNEEGAMGLIINKKNEILSKRFREVFGVDIKVYEGGPVEPNRLLFIIKSHQEILGEKIDRQYYFTNDAEEVVNKIFENKITIDDIKVFSGYSGWTKNQLDNEISHRFWQEAQSSAIDYTASYDDTLWKFIMQNLGDDFLIWANAPKDIRLN